MMTNPFRSRHAILWVILLFYLLPNLAICIYITTFIPSSYVWNTLSWGLLMSFMGSLAFFGIMHSWETSLKTPVSTKIPPKNDLDHSESKASEPSQQEVALMEQLEKWKNQYDQLNSEKQIQDEELLVLHRDKDICQQQYESLYQSHHQDKMANQEQFQHHQNFIQELQDTIDQHRVVIEKKQQQISQLETKVGDLTYEIKTLLHLAESTHAIIPDKPISKGSSETYEPPYPYGAEFEEEETTHLSKIQVHSCDDAMVQLKRCLDIAQKITGSSHFSSESSRFRDLPVDNFVLDLRRLCDSLRSENHSAILLYSPKEDKVIFANNQVKTLIGWSPEKIVQNFADIIQEGEQEWKNNLAHISLKNESQIRLLLKTKKGHDLLTHCHLGMIPTGVFRYHVIGVLHPA